MKYSSEIDKGVIISYERMLNDVLNEFSKNIINVFTLNMMIMKCEMCYIVVKL